MAGCGVERVGEARMEDHWEADHKDRLVEEWIYQVSGWGPVARILLRWGGGVHFLLLVGQNSPFSWIGAYLLF